MRLKCPDTTLSRNSLSHSRVWSYYRGYLSKERNATLEVSPGKPNMAVWLSKVIVHSGEKVFSWPDIQWSESINSRDQGIYVI